MLNVSCHTNIDDFRYQKWPEEMQILPAIGDRVRSEAGKELKVCGFTHGMTYAHEGLGRSVPKACIFIELNK